MDNIYVAEIKRVLDLTKGKKIIVWGTANIASFLFGIIQALGYEVAYFLSSRVEEQGKTCYGKPIYLPSNLLNESINSIVVLLAFTNSYEVLGQIKEFGLTMEVNCFDLKRIQQPLKCNLYDPLLGYSRLDDIEGYKIFHPEYKKRIVVLGNSTTDWSVSGLRSWPYWLSELLVKSGYEYSVYNGATVGYYSGQECLKCIRDILSLMPDIVISCSGINDAGWLKASPDHPYICKWQNNVVKKTTEQRSAVTSLREIGYGLSGGGDAVSFWLNNERMMHAVCGEFGIQFYAFLQPAIISKNYRISSIEAKALEIQYSSEYLEEVREFFRKESEKIREYSYIYDFTTIYDGEEGIFYDLMHTDEKGSQKMAQKIFDVIKKHI